MEPFIVLGQHAVERALSDLGHSALPNAPVQPYDPPRRWRLRMARSVHHRRRLRLWPMRRRRPCDAATVA